MTDMCISKYEDSIHILNSLNIFSEQNGDWDMVIEALIKYFCFFHTEDKSLHNGQYWSHSFLKISKYEINI